MNLINEAGAASFFVDPTLIGLDEETLIKWYKEYPALTEFYRTIELVRRYKPYTLSNECEKLLADMQGALNSHSDIRTVFASAYIRFGKITGEDGKKIALTDSTYVPLLMSGNRRVRRAAFCRLYETYRQFGNTFSTLLNGYIKEKVTISKIRGYESSLHASVYADEVTPDIYNNLIDTVNNNLDVLYKYYDLKAEVLGLKKLRLYDIYAPLIKSSSREYSYEEAVDEVLSSVKIFGEEYHGTLEKGLKKGRWVDVYPSKSKRGGAYSAGCYDTRPYILLNFNGKLNDISTLAHEAGHSMHSFFSRKNNTPQNSQYTIFVAEVASTVNELVYSRKKLRESESDEEKLTILNEIMETYKGTLYRQTMFAEFEKEMYRLSSEGEPLTKDLLSSKYYELVKKYFGKHVFCDKDIECEWMRIPHFYRFFYVYKYATCISAASSIVKKIESRGEAYIEKYLEFLKCGGSKSPLESLLIADIDLTKPQVIEDAISDFAETIEQFKELYTKVNK